MKTIRNVFAGLAILLFLVFVVGILLAIWGQGTVTSDRVAISALIFSGLSGIVWGI